MSRTTHRRRAPGEEFALPITDAINDLEHEYDCAIHLRVEPTGRRGVMQLRVEAYGTEDPAEVACIAAEQLDWPNAYLMDMPATVFKLVNGLARLLADNQMDRVLSRGSGRRARGGR